MMLGRRNIKRRIKEAEKELRFFWDQRPDQHMLSKCKVLADELDELDRLEESYWHLRERANELRDGDKNTPTFTIRPFRDEGAILLRGFTMKETTGAPMWMT
ncbi:D-aminoacyl-tRNA deacylase [Bienertia sinuspersici]